MRVGFGLMRVGETYDRDRLASLWGYQGRQAISRGVVTPAGTNVIILFVTENKDASVTPYADALRGKILRWEGEAGHGSDQRILSAAKARDEIHLLYREASRAPFEYLGKIRLLDYKLPRAGPMRCRFAVGGRRRAALKVVSQPSRSTSGRRALTARAAVSKGGSGKGTFRSRLFRAWGGCSVTGVSTISLLKAAHIKPWRKCSRSERKDAANGLLLIPSLAHLLGKGLITFDRLGAIRISRKLSSAERKALNVHRGMSLLKLPRGTRRFLRFHRDHIFTNATGG